MVFYEVRCCSRVVYLGLLTYIFRWNWPIRGVLRPDFVLLEVLVTFGRPLEVLEFDTNSDDSGSIG